jgi:hypothetical protein
MVPGAGHSMIALSDGFPMDGEERYLQGAGKFLKDEAIPHRNDSCHALTKY